MASLVRPHSPSRAAVLAAAMILVATTFPVAAPAQAQILPWEIAVAEIEAGRLRGLAERLGKRIEHVPDSVIRDLQAYSWTGNVRELENVIERAMILTTGDTLQLPSGVLPIRRTKGSRNSALRSLAEVEADHIRSVLEQTDGVIAGPQGAAKVLDINPNTLRSRMERLGITLERTNGN